jgi:hypothetical protein
VKFTQDLIHKLQIMQQLSKSLSCAAINSMSISTNKDNTCHLMKGETSKEILSNVKSLQFEQQENQV